MNVLRYGCYIARIKGTFVIAILGDADKGSPSEVLLSNENMLRHLFIISQLWLTSHPRSTVVLLDTGTPGTSKEIYSEDADDVTRTRNPSVINRVL